MGCDHPFSERNMATERTVDVGVGCDREVKGEVWGGVGLGGEQHLKKRGIGKIVGSS